MSADKYPSIFSAKWRLLFIYNLFLKRKVGVTERPRSLNPSKAVAMAIFPIIVARASKRRSNCLVASLNFEMKPVLESYRVRTGPGKPGKPWKKATGPEKFWKSVTLN